MACGKRILESAPGYESAAGAYDAVYVFRREGGSWAREARLTAEEAVPGFGAVLLPRGERLFVGAGAGVQAFERRGGRWERFGTLPEPAPEPRPRVRS